SRHVQRHWAADVLCRVGPRRGHLARRHVAAGRTRGMRKYSATDEERLRMQAQVREWTSAGLLDADRGAALAAQLRIDLRRTNVLVRVALALFTAVIIAASVALVLVVLHLRDDRALAVLFAFAALGCALLAEYLAGEFRFYRYGVEEMAAVLAVVLLC